MYVINVGDQVRFRMGRGYSTGRVASITDGIATISTSTYKLVKRKVCHLELEAMPADCSADELPASTDPLPFA